MRNTRYITDALKIHMQSAAQYRASLLMQILSQVVIIGGDLMTMVVLLSRFTTMGGWTAGEIGLFFGVMQVSFSLCEMFAGGFAKFSSMISQGTFDTLLIRPRPLLMQIVLSGVDLRRLGGLAVGSVGLVIAFSMNNLTWTWDRLLLLLWVLIGSTFLMVGLFIIEALISFFSVKSIEMVNVLTYGGRTACQYPIDLYPKPIRVLFTCVAPIGLTMHIPLAHILDKPIWHVPAWSVWLFPLSGVLFCLLMGLVWEKVGVRKYRGTGS